MFIDRRGNILETGDKVVDELGYEKEVTIIDGRAIIGNEIVSSEKVRSRYRKI